MPNLSLSDTPLFESNESTVFTERLVYLTLKESVYPPCSIHPRNIRYFHSIESNLGYVGGKQILAGKTNRAFALIDPYLFTGNDMEDIDIVEEHMGAVIERLKKLNRMEA